MTSSLFVWTYLPGQAQPVVAGRIDIERTAAGAAGRFTYGRSYRERADALPLDPVTLPLREGVQTYTGLLGFPGVVMDACPDSWGRRVIDRLLGVQDFPAGYLLLNDPGRSGCLAFSGDALTPPVELPSREFPLPDLLAAARAVETDAPLDAELLRALHPGTGGARPKCAVTDAQGVWIAKFPSVADPPDIRIPRLEHATLRLAAACGIRAARSRIETLGEADVCLVQRFDRIARTAGGCDRLAFISARSVFYADPGFVRLGIVGSYGRLARWMSRYGCADAQREELFRRMVFNVAVRNADDHDLNHGLVRVGSRFQLADAYDLVPTLVPHRIHHHALLIGDSAAGTIANLLSNAEAFGLDRAQAGTLIEAIQATIQDRWRRILAEEGGLEDREIAFVAPWFAPILA